MLKQQQAISLLSTVAKDNTSEDMRCCFVGQNTALAGHRRIYDEMGDCLVRIRAQQIEPDMVSERGLFYYANDQFVVCDGLLGELKSENSREIVTPDRAEEFFSKVQHSVRDGYSVLLNPKAVCEFLEDKTRNIFENMKVNIGFFAGANSYLNLIPADIKTVNQEYFVAFPFQDSELARRAGAVDHIYEEGHLYGLFPINERESSPRYMWKDKMFVKLINVYDNYGNMLQNREAILYSGYQPGIRMAVQKFTNGLKMLNSPGYTLFQNPDAKVYENDIHTFPFIRGQERLTTSFLDCPTLHFDADTLHRALKPMEMFRVVRMDFLDSITGAYITTMQEEWPFTIDAIVGAANPFVNGRVWTV